MLEIKCYYSVSTAAHYPNFSFRAVAITATPVLHICLAKGSDIKAEQRYKHTLSHTRLFIYTPLGNTGGLHPLKARVYSDQVHFHRISSRVLREESVTRAPVDAKSKSPFRFIFKVRSNIVLNIPALRTPDLHQLIHTHATFSVSICSQVMYTQVILKSSVNILKFKRRLNRVTTLC